MPTDLVGLPNIDTEAFEVPKADLGQSTRATHRPRILLLYGSLRERSFSRFATIEAARLLEALGAETRIFNPSGLLLLDYVLIDHSIVKVLRDLSSWSEG